MIRISSAAFALFLAAALQAQFPGGGYPPGGYPGQGPGIPAPRFPRRGKSTETARPAQVLTGTLRKFDKDSLVLEMPDARVITFKLAVSTKIYKDSAEARASDFHTGDEVQVEATEDENGYLHAQRVTWLKAAAQPAAAAGPRNTADTPPPAPPDPDDPGPPELRRGKPARPAITEHSEEAAEPLPAGDPVIEKARGAVASFDEKLPNYVCRQVTTRYSSAARPVSWQPLDVITADVVYEDGKEDYRNIAINGKATSKKMEQLPGSWSTGEYATTLTDVFAASTAADFHPRLESTIAGRAALVYDFSVDQPNSHWTVQVASQTLRPAYRGSVWIDKQTFRVLRVEMQARKIPEEFPLDTVESAVDYEFVRLGGTTEYLLPVHADMLTCERGANACSRNTIDFRNYHRFTGESSITFGK